MIVYLLEVRACFLSSSDRQTCCINGIRSRLRSRSLMALHWIGKLIRTQRVKLDVFLGVRLKMCVCMSFISNVEERKERNSLVMVILTVTDRASF